MFYNSKYAFFAVILSGASSVKATLIKSIIELFGKSLHTI